MAAVIVLFTAWKMRHLGIKDGYVANHMLGCQNYIFRAHVYLRVESLWEAWHMATGPHFELRGRSSEVVVRREERKKHGVGTTHQRQGEHADYHPLNLLTKVFGKSNMALGQR